MEVFPLKRKNVDRKRIYEMILEDFSNFHLKDGDIISISSKIVSLSEGRILPSDKESCVIEREAERVWNSFSNLKLSIVYGFLSPNSGIDFSNVEKGSMILYPTNPNLKAEELRLIFLLYFGVYVGVILVDSRLFPLRKGTSGIAIGFSGITPIKDERGKRDLFGNRLKVTKRSIVDDLAAIAHVVMGESDEKTPYVVIRGLKEYIVKRKTDYNISVPFTECLYFRSLNTRVVHNNNKIKKNG